MITSLLLFYSNFQLVRKAVLKNEYGLVKEEFDTITGILDELPDFCPNAIEHILENQTSKVTTSAAWCQIILHDNPYQSIKECFFLMINYILHLYLITFNACTFAKLEFIRKSNYRRLISYYFNYFQIPKANFMRDELSAMEKEINTIKEITQTLPDFCPSSSDHCLEC